MERRSRICLAPRALAINEVDHLPLDPAAARCSSSASPPATRRAASPCPQTGLRMMRPVSRALLLSPISAARA